MRSGSMEGMNKENGRKKTEAGNCPSECYLGNIEEVLNIF